MRPLEIPFRTAHELLEYISPLNSMWSSGSFIFRGQGSDTYKLTPSICRRGPGSFAEGAPIKAFADTVARQVYLELEVISRFLEGCDRSGLVVPGYTMAIKERLALERGKYLSSSMPWPRPEMHQIMAVAQHYDVPTRLLDWTERSFVACYFAASSADLEIHSMTMPKIAIWALNTSYASEWNTVSLVRTPGGTSQNQAAQSGLFTTHNVHASTFSDVYNQEALEELEEVYGHGANGSLLKLTLPIEEAPDLLKLCSSLGVDASTLFPGFHGVAKSVKDWANVAVGVRPSRALQDEYNQLGDGY
jgi:hypothetical protein